MKILTINIIVDNKQQFIEENDVVLKKIKENQNVEICILENVDGRYFAFKELLDNTDSKYTAFYDDNTVLENDAVKSLVNELKNYDEPVLLQRMSAEISDNGNVYPTGGKLKRSLYIGRYIFKTELLKNIQIEENEYPFYEEKILLTAMRDMEEIKMLTSSRLITDVMAERNVNSYTKQFEKDWYLAFFEQFVLPYAKNTSLTPSEQRMIVYFIMIRFYLNLNSRDKQVLQGEEVDKFFGLVDETTKHIEDEYLVEVATRGMLPKFFSYLLLKGKYGEVTFDISKEESDFVYKVKDTEYGKNCIETRVQAINYENGKLIVDGEIVGDYCLDNVENQFAVQLNGKDIKYFKTGRFNIAKAFGRAIYRYYPFQFEIPEDKVEGKSKIEFKILINKEWCKTTISFDKTSSRLVRSKYSYFEFSDKMITFSDEALCIDKADKKKIIMFELKTAIKTIRTAKKKKTAFKLVALRGLYWMTKKRYSKKPVWIFFDKLYKAGDNAEYLFRYCMENHPEADCYYILNKTANEYKGLKKEYGKHIVPFETKRNQLAVLNAQYIFATHASVWGFCGFNKTYRENFKNLLKADVVCIQHGLTIQNIAQYQNRLADNTKKYFCASKYEIQNISRPVYGYNQESLCLTGSPRYDGLVNRDVKQILIAPTWRRNIVITGNKMGTAKSYNPDFKYTKYFEIYNSLINDRRITEVVKEYGYKLVFLIHPTLSSQVEDYDTNESLSIIPAVSDVSYEKMLTESSLMVTDYSGIQFDFAYMKKPILYYQPKELPPQYTEGVYQYETMGFGPIIDEYEKIVESICDAVKNGCKMEEEYIARVDDFFEYTDHSNCERIMKEMLKNKA